MVPAQLPMRYTLKYQDQSDRIFESTAMLMGCVALVLFSMNQSSTTKILIGAGFLSLILLSYKIRITENKKALHRTFLVEIHPLHLSLDANLIPRGLSSGAAPWEKYREGQQIKIPWKMITSWRFYRSRAVKQPLYPDDGVNSDMYHLGLEGVPTGFFGRYLPVQRTPFLEIEDHFFAIVQYLILKNQKDRPWKEIPLVPFTCEEKSTRLWLET